MGNKLPENIKIGTFGELLVQLRLLQFGVQAAPPIKDTGNDLIAVRGEAIRLVQVKTRTDLKLQVNNLPKHWHILALVRLEFHDEELALDECEISLISRQEYKKNGLPKDLSPFRISKVRVNALFPPQ
jgi:hypothetical protein